MKYPILYEENEKVFTHLGLGPLTNTLKTHVVEERNGAFYLDMEVLVDDIKYPLLQEDRIIKADAGHILKDQRFRIKKIVPKEDNKAEVYAEHVSYLAQELSLKPEAGATGTADSAIKTWKGNIIDKNDFIVDSDITTVSSTTWKINEVKNAREALGGVKGSILDRWGGEYRFDNYHISLLKKRGKTAETLLAYGRNITDFEQERNIKNTYNAVYPFVVYRDDDKNDDVIFTLKDYIVDSKYVANYPNRKALPVDFSSEFKDGEKPTAEKLKRLAEQYIVNNEIGVPTVSIKLKFIDLSKTLDYEELAPLEQLNLCDDVRIVYPKLGVDTVSKVIRVVWDHLTEKYYELEIGQKRLTLSNIIREQETAINEIHTETNHALLAANGKNTNFYGLYGENGLGEPTATRIDDTWFKPNGENTEMYRWDGLVWKFIFSTAPDNSITEKIEELEKISKDVQEKAEEALSEAEISRDEARQAKKQAFNSEQLANSAKQDAILAVQKGDQNTTKITTLEGQQKLTNTKVEGNTANIMSLQSDSERLSLSIGKVQSDVENTQSELATLEVNYRGFEQTVSSDVDGLYSQQTQTKNQLSSTVQQVNNLYEPKANMIKNSMDIMLNKSDSGVSGKHSFSEGYFSFRTGNLVADVFNDADIFTTEPRAKSEKFTLSMDVNSFGASFNIYIKSSDSWEGPFNIKGASGRRRVYVEYTQQDRTASSALPLGIKITDIKTFSRFEYGKFKLIKGHTQDLYDVAYDDIVQKSEIIQLKDQITSTVTKVTTVEGIVTNQQTQITQLSNNINLKVDKDNIITQINLSHEQALIQAKRIHLSGESLIDDAIITNAMIQNLAISTAKIQDASISNVKILNMDAAKITTGYLNADRIEARSIRAEHLHADAITIGFNEASKVAKIHPDNLEFQNKGVRTARLTTQGYEIWAGSRRLGHVGMSELASSQYVKGLGINLDSGGDYITFGYKENSSSTTYTPIISVDPKGVYTLSKRPGVHIDSDVYFKGFISGNTFVQQRMKFGSLRVNGQDLPALRSESGNSGIGFGSNTLYLISNGSYQAVS
ncbi:phage tail protein [Vagococcus fluvialis]|uniref:phage tail spike protein n=1 Tax=Vagococcus fluvialis TaxID=2738 RepID=UPI000A32DFFD|nr:phage tail spike protein [Vagococcus fluvialis]MBO0419110.1 phage tail protein [Vagococcus fluvialis]OTP29535.1 hypothetical protein A5798_002703 [Enterococcus sp. 6C8_DIV0013]